MKGIWIAVLLMIVSTGCATHWQTQLWQTQDDTGETPELGGVETESLNFGILTTAFRKVGKPSDSFIGISVSCRNQSNGTFALELNPIQVVGPSQVLMKPLPLDHVMYKLFGGQLRERAQHARLAELSQPVTSSGSLILDTAIAYFAPLQPH